MADRTEGSGRIDGPVETEARDQRQFVRVPLSARAMWTPEQGAPALPCTIVNLSGGGAKICVPVERNALIPVSVPNDDGFRGMSVLSFRLGSYYEFPAHVVWVERADRQLFLGLEWARTDNPLRERLVWELMRITVQRRRHHR